MRCDDCRESSDTVVWSGYFMTNLCEDCFNQRCKDEGKSITLDDLEEMCGDEP